MSTIEFLFHEPSAIVDRLSAPRSVGGGRYAITATLTVHLDAGDATIGRLDPVLPMLAEISDRLFAEEDGGARSSIKIETRPKRDEVRLRLREFDSTIEAVTDDGAEVVASAKVEVIRAVVDGAGVSVSVGLGFDVRADQVGELVRLLGAVRAQARSEQLELLPAVPPVARVDRVTLLISTPGSR